MRILFSLVKWHQNALSRFDIANLVYDRRKEGLQKGENELRNYILI